jgi:hypothetical protein
VSLISSGLPLQLKKKVLIKISELL